MGCSSSLESGAPKPAPASTTPSVKTFSALEVGKHNSLQDCWVVVDGSVYELPARWVLQHPGGSGVVVRLAGRDASEIFERSHGLDARRRLQHFFIGKLKAAEPPCSTDASPCGASATADAAPAQPASMSSRSETTPPTAPHSNKGPGSTDEAEQTQGTGFDQAGSTALISHKQSHVSSIPPEQPSTHAAPSSPALGALPWTQDPSAPSTLLGPDQAISLQLTERRRVSRNTFILRLALPGPSHRLGLPPGQHVRLSAHIDGQQVTRAYTPITPGQAPLGYLDLLIKVYFPGAHPDHPAGGKMSQHLHSIPIGAPVQVSGPAGRFTYLGRGAYTYEGRRGAAARLSMVCGGTGITPAYGVITSVLADSDDITQISLVYANQTEADILLRGELEGLAAAHPGRLRLYHVLLTPPQGWRQGSGYVTPALMAEHLFPAGQDTAGLMCGPPGLSDGVCAPGYAGLGYEPLCILRF